MPKLKSRSAISATAEYSSAPDVEASWTNSRLGAGRAPTSKHVTRFWSHQGLLHDTLDVVDAITSVAEVYSTALTDYTDGGSCLSPARPCFRQMEKGPNVSGLSWKCPQNPTGLMRHPAAAYGVLSRHRRIDRGGITFRARCARIIRGFLGAHAGCRIGSVVAPYAGGGVCCVLGPDARRRISRVPRPYAGGRVGRGCGPDAGRRIRRIFAMATDS